ncbi:MAG: DUF1540 domain-containing protein [Clostridia bacterium]|nr:DUF1540 domain-containing protein [Clostridia bacterium]
MSQKQPNSHIRCRVNSCQYHLDDKDCCSLGAIQVEPCECCSTGKPSDESCCGSYRHK